MHKGVSSLSQSWASQAVGSRVVEFEKHLRIICGYVFHHENGFTSNQSAQFHTILKDVSDLLVNHASPQAFEAVARCSVLHYLAFCALRTREKSPECLDAFWSLMQTVVAVLKMPKTCHTNHCIGYVKNIAPLLMLFRPKQKNSWVSGYMVQQRFTSHYKY